MWHLVLDREEHTWMRESNDRWIIFYDSVVDKFYDYIVCHKKQYISQLNQENEFKDLISFKNIKQGSLYFKVSVTSKEAVYQIYEMYSSGRLLDLMEKHLLTDEVLLNLCCKEILLKIHMDETLLKKICGDNFGKNRPLTSSSAAVSNSKASVY